MAGKECVLLKAEEQSLYELRNILRKWRTDFALKHRNRSFALILNQENEKETSF